jgi:chromosome segregation ATPase
MTAPEKAGTPASEPPDDVQQVQQEIEQTREHLGDTVEQLAAKADVKARTRDKAAELAGRVESTTSRARQQAAVRAESLRGQIAAAGAPAWEATPEGIRRAVTKGASNAKERRVPLAVAAGAVLFACLAVRRWRRR